MVITVEEAKSLETELEVVEGMQFDRGRTPQSLEAVAGGGALALVLAPFGAAKSIPRSRRGR
jgi:chaperonin GroEL (HSP60 family)